MNLESLHSIQHTIEPKDDGFVIRTQYGYIEYRPVDDVNEIWWVESHKKNHGSELVDLMQMHHPASAIAWGVTSRAGEGLRKKWHRHHPKIESIHGEPHDGQFNPYG